MATESQIIANPACRGEASGEAGSRSAQKELIMQNKPNFPNAQINVNSVLTIDYVNIRLRRHFKNKANQSQSNPIQSQFQTSPALRFLNFAF